MSELPPGPVQRGAVREPGAGGPAGSAGAAKCLGHSVIFGKFKGTGTRRLQTVEKGSRQLSLKQNKAK